MTTTEDLTEVDQTVARAQDLSASLRKLAELLDKHPDFSNELRFAGFDRVITYVTSKERMAEYVRVLKAAGATIRKGADTKYFNVDCTLGPVTLHVYAAREAVCERVVVGTETVTKTVPDPALLAEVPEIKVTEDVEIVRWDCHPILRDATGDAEVSA